ncbi:MAG: hypothetical protein GY714_24425 [Desulfobacterales bacterium]|nr:hypothetical protein [Desulfobacterales bacterium]
MDSQAIFSGLYSHFVRRGFRANEVGDVLKNIFSLINNGAKFEIDKMNEELEKEGWPKDTIDETCYDLIVQLFENEIKSQ